MSEQNVFQRINAIRKAIGYIQKDKSVSAGAAGSYRAVTHDAVTGMVRQHLIEHGVAVVPSLLRSSFDQKEEGAKQRLYSATYKIDFVNIDKPDDRVSIEMESHALDNGDKAPGKALSYATKYAILKLFNLETGEDEESRYQQDVFDVDPHLDAIEACTTLPELQATYTASYKAATASGDSVAMKAIISAKDRAKKVIEDKSK